MSYRAEEGAAASGLAINLPNSIDPEVFKTALEICSGLGQYHNKVDRDAVSVGKGAAGSVALNVYSTSANTTDRDITESVSSSSDSHRSSHQNDDELLQLVSRKKKSCNAKLFQHLTRRPTEAENFEMAFLILEDWDELRIYITPNSAQFKRRTNTITADRMADPHRKAKRFLDMWVATFGAKANVYRLCKVLIERGKEAHAEEIFGVEAVAFITEPE